LGRRLRIRLLFGQNPVNPWSTVVGVVKNIKHDGLDVDGVPHLYVPLNQLVVRTLSLAMRTSVPATTLEAQIRGAIQSVDPGCRCSTSPRWMRYWTHRWHRAGFRRIWWRALRVGALAGLDRNLRLVGLYGRAKISGDQCPHGPARGEPTF
jgi:hypothetical protein